MEELWLSRQSVVAALVALAITLILIGRNRNKTRNKGRSLPGPWGWPVLGIIPRMGRVPHLTLAEFAKRYGPLMFMKLGSVNVVVASSSKVAEEFLKTHDKIWANRSPPTAAKIITYLGEGVIWTEYGPRWRYLRKIFMLELFTVKRLSAFQGVRKEEIVRGINEAITTCESGAKSAQIDLILKKIATNVITRMMLNGGNLGEEASKIKNSEDLQVTMKETFSAFSMFYIGDFIPSLKWVDPQGVRKKMYGLAKKWDTLFQKIFDEHKKNDYSVDRPDENKVQDIVDVLLTRPRDFDGQYLTESEIKGVFLDIIFGGTDANAHTPLGGLYELLRHPRVLEKAQAEMDSVVGRDRLVEESDLPNLPYLKAILYETFRLQPSAKMLVPHISTEDCEIQGWKIPKETMLLVNIHAIHRDPELYERPLDFYPERFFGSDIDVDGTDCRLIPFGSGRRACPAKGQGYLMVHYTMALIIQTCNLKLPENTKPEDLDPEQMRTKSLHVVVTPRLSRHILVTRMEV